MVGMGVVMLAVAWWGNWLRWRGRLETTRWFLWCALLAFPSGFLAVLAGWFTAEVGRQPWVVYHLLRTADAVTPALTGGVVLSSLLTYVAVYSVLGAFGVRYIYQVLRAGPTAQDGGPPDTKAGQPVALAPEVEAIRRSDTPV
jgi:cytochrome d ubiquinol oxidase subunit I